MNLLYKGQLLHEEELKLPITNRAFQYNDGFFETIIIVNGKIRFWQDHLDRMFAAAKALKLELPDLFKNTAFEYQLLDLAGKNNALTYGRVKLKIWRGGDGLYTPEVNSIEWLATVQPAEPTALVIEKVGLCMGVRTHYNPLSFFKGPNALLYVQAGLEKKEKGYDDVILLNRHDLVSELTSSNIFWYKHGILNTPSLETGCINGIMRRNILNWCRQEGIKTKAVYFDIDGLLQSEAVFSANVTGVKEIKNLVGFNLNQSAPVFIMLRDKINLAS